MLRDLRIATARLPAWKSCPALCWTLSVGGPLTGIGFTGFRVWGLGHEAECDARFRAPCAGPVDRPRQCAAARGPRRRRRRGGGAHGLQRLPAHGDAGAGQHILR